MASLDGGSYVSRLAGMGKTSWESPPLEIQNEHHNDGLSLQPLAAPPPPPQMPKTSGREGCGHCKVHPPCTQTQCWLGLAVLGTEQQATPAGKESKEARGYGTYTRDKCFRQLCQHKKKPPRTLDSGQSHRITEAQSRSAS